MPHAATLPASGRHPFFWVAAAAAPLCLVIYIGGAVAIWRYGSYAQSFGWTAAATRHGLVVASVERGGAADGILQPGEVITGVSTGVIPPIGYYRRSAPVDRPYTIRVASPGPTQVTLTAPVVRVARLGRLITLFLSAVTFGAVGLFFGLVRPDLPTGRLLCFAAVGTGFNQLFATLDSFSDQLPWMERLANGGLSLSVGMANAVLFQATVRLPGPSVPRILWPGLGTILYMLAAATVVTFGVPGAILWWTDADVASRILFGSTWWFAGGPMLRTVTELLTSLGILAVLGWKLAFVRDPAEQRRLRWLTRSGLIASHMRARSWKTFSGFWQCPTWPLMSATSKGMPRFFAHSTAQRVCTSSRRQSRRRTADRDGDDRASHKPRRGRQNPCRRIRGPLASLTWVPFCDYVVR